MTKTFLLALAIGLPLHAAEPLLTFENRPLGRPDAPLILNTYLPDPGLDPAVFAHHDKGQPVAKYNPGRGEDVAGTDHPIPGIPSALAVSFGPALAYAFDTTECRPLYAWQGGFLDMTPYWGDQKRGSRVSFDYTPRLVGSLFHKASGKQPVHISGKNAADLGLEYTGYSLVKKVPVFAFKAGNHQLTLTLRPSSQPLSFEATLTCQPPAPLAWREGPFAVEGNGEIHFTHNGSELATFQGYKVDIDLSKPNIEAGETLFNNYGCAGCHSLDGSKGHGPTLMGLAGDKRAIEGSDDPVLADHAYLLESIRNPNAKIAKDYPPSYMPPFSLPDAEYESLILFIQSVGKPE